MLRGAHHGLLTRGLCRRRLARVRTQSCMSLAGLMARFAAGGGGGLRRAAALRASRLQRSEQRAEGRLHLSDGRRIRLRTRRRVPAAGFVDEKGGAALLRTVVISCPPRRAGAAGGQL